MSRTNHPLIAVNGLYIETPEPSLRLANRYADSILKAGGVPLAIPPVGGPHDIDRLLDSVDGVLLTGGDDFIAEKLGLGATHPAADPTHELKQDFDFVLARKVLERELPVLGICYGMQVMGLLDGAGLIQDIPSERPEMQEHRSNSQHDVIIEPQTKLGRILGVDRLSTISRHHQALSAPSEPWIASAVDEFGLIEAIEHTALPFAVGVQWHPELSPEGTANDRLFQSLVGAAGIAYAERTFARS